MTLTRPVPYIAGKPYPPPLPEQEEYVVEFAGQDDPRHAQNFPLKTKVIISVILVFDSLTATFASSIFSPAIVAVGKEFNVGEEVVTLGTSLFVLGYAVGPPIWAPLSELYGRRVPVIIGGFGFAIFNTAVAVAKDYQTLMICRFFGGVFGSCPLTLCGAILADMFNNKVGAVYELWPYRKLNSLAAPWSGNRVFRRLNYGGPFLWSNGRRVSCSDFLSWLALDGLDTRVHGIRRHRGLFVLAEGDLRPRHFGVESCRVTTLDS